MTKKEEIQDIISQLEALYVPDKRTVVFNIKVSRRKDKLILQGETSHKEARDQIFIQAAKISVQIKDDIRLLPDDSVGDKYRGIINNSVEKIHACDSYASEVVSEALLGMLVKILDCKGDWRRIQTPDDYIGWICGGVETFTEEELNCYMRLPRIIVTKLYSTSYIHADSQSQTVSDLVIGDKLVITDSRKDFYQVLYPDGREAYVCKTDARLDVDWQESIVLSGERVVETAMQFSGIPYVWGGASSKGLDCSGFTKMVYLLHGINLPRDASQQVNCGKMIDEKKDLNQCRLGDLLFFGSEATSENKRERVVHVGLYIGNKRFIHASDYVKTGSFDPDDELYDAHNANRYLRAKRIIEDIDAEDMEK